MELKIMSLDGEAAGSVELPDAIFGLEPRPDILHRCVRWQLAKRQRGTHDVKNRSRNQPHRQEDVSAEGHRLGPSRSGQGQSLPRRRPVVRADPAQPCDRSAEEGARARPQACLVRQGQGRRHHRARQGHREGRQDRARCGRTSPSSVSPARSSSTAPRSRRTSRWPRATFRTSTSCRCRASTSTTSCGGRCWC